MFKDKLVETLNRSKTKEKEDKKATKAINKIQRQKRLSSDEFQKVYDTVWKEGPKVKYQSPDAWRKLGEGDKST
jgi:membrane-associated HD superfamily phosphohydrolase